MSDESAFARLGLARVGIYRALDGHGCLAQVSVRPVVRCGCGAFAYYEGPVGVGHVRYVEQRGPMCLPLVLPAPRT